MSTLAKKIEQYVKLRDHKAKAKKAFDQSMTRINEAVEKLDGEILKGLQDEGLENSATAHGTAYINTQASVTVKDREKFEEWAEKTGNTAAMDIRANKVVVREILNGGTDVPGVKFTERKTIGVRRK